MMVLSNLPKRCPVCGRVMTEEEDRWTCGFCGKEEEKQ